MIVDGRIVYVIDGYTTTNHYPNAQRADNADVSEDSGRLATSTTCAPVKATVDAYDGTITMFVIDDTDPLIRAYQKAFPELFTPGKPLPGDLREQFLPGGSVPVQTQMWGRYHTDNPLPSTTGPTSGTSPRSGGERARDDRHGHDDRRSGAPQSPRVDPYYLQLRLPDEEKASFALFGRSWPAWRRGGRARSHPSWR